MFTQCSQCETVFKLSAEVLRAAGGQVRCGKCGEVFNALAQLAEDASAFTTGESSFDLETRADNILQTPVPPTPRRPQPPEDTAPPGIEIARLQILDWNESDTAQAPPVPVDDLSEDQAGETSMEFTLPPGELDRIFVATKKGVRPLEAEPEEIEVFDASAPTLTPAPPQPPVPSGFEVSEDVRREMLSVMDPSSEPEFAPEPESGLEVIERPARRVRRRTRGPRRSSPFDLAPQETSSRTFAAWLSAAVAAAVLLIVQVVHQNREWLAAHAPLGGSLGMLYTKMGAPVSSSANLSAYQLRQWGVTGDPAGDGTLRVRASILNTTAQLEPYPLLRVTLANRFGGSIGTRDFEPSEYLGKPTAKLLAPGERADATLDILDPGKSAEGFEIDVCLRGSERKVSCANDKAPAQAKR